MDLSSGAAMREIDIQVPPHIEDHARELCDGIRVRIIGKEAIWDSTDAETRNWYRRHALWINSIERAA